MICSGGVPWTCMRKVWCLALAWGVRMMLRSSRSSGSENLSTFRLVLPLSILDMSSTSLMRLSR